MCDGMCRMWLAPGIPSIRRSAHRSARLGVVELEHLARRAVDIDVGEDHRLGRRVVPVVAGRLLIVPDVFAGVGVQRQRGVVIQVLLAGAALAIVGSGIAAICSRFGREGDACFVAGVGVGSDAEFTGFVSKATRLMSNR